MDKQLKLTLSVNGRTIVIGQGSRYRLLSYDGFEAGDYQTILSEYSDIDGAFIRNQRVLQRTVDICFETVSGDDEENRRALVSFFNPKKEGVLKIDRGLGEREIRFYVSEVNFIQKNLYMPLRVDASLICPNPYFSDTVTVSHPAMDMTPLLTFPLNIIKESGVTSGFIRSGDSYTINNTGDQPIGIQLYMTASGGEVVNPKISCEMRYIDVMETLAKGDSLYISTEPGRKRIELNGYPTYNFNRASRFFTVSPGVHNITITASEGIGNLESVLTYSPCYLGA